MSYVVLFAMVWTWSKVIFTTAAATVGAAILIANSPFAVPKRSPFNLKQLEQGFLKYLDGSGRMVHGKDLWNNNGAVIMVVRRPG